MTKRNYAAWIASTLSAPMVYTSWGPGGGDIPNQTGGVNIAGGANIPDKYMRTPEGAVLTPVTAEELEILMSDKTFQLHEKNGFIKILDKEPKNAEIPAADMEGRDPSAPLVDQDFDDASQPKPNGDTKKSGKA